MCYDITDRQSFLNLDTWNNEIIKYASSTVKVILCGTKMDMVSKRQVSFEEGRNYAEKNGYEFYETSAKNNKNIDELFEKPSEYLLNNFLIDFSGKKNLKENSQFSIKPKITKTIKIGTKYKDIINTKCC
jgi:GTPase SAR1 family protein